MHNLPALAFGLRDEFKKNKGKETMEESMKDMAEEADQDYIPEDEEHSEDETLKKPKKVCQCYFTLLFLFITSCTRYLAKNT